MSESSSYSFLRFLRASKFRRFSRRSYVYAGDNIVQELKTIGTLTLKKEYINGIGTDSLIAYDAQESTNQAEISFCQARVLPYSSEFTTYGYASIISRCTDIQTSGTGIVTNRYYYHTNHLGSVIALTNGSGNIVQNYSYDSFGKAYVVSGSGILTTIDGNTNLYGNTRLYTGREYDREINLYFLRARYYNPETGRFISRDPIGQRDQINLYTYVKNSPLVYMDRMGLNSKPFISSAWDVYMTWSDNNGEYLYNLTSVINQSDVVKDLERIRNYGGAVTVAAIPLLFFPATAPIGGGIILGAGGTSFTAGATESIITRSPGPVITESFGVAAGPVFKATASSLGILSKGVGVLSKIEVNAGAERFIGYYGDKMYGFVSNKVAGIAQSIDPLLGSIAGFVGGALSQN